MTETKNLKTLDNALDLIPLSKFGEYSSAFTSGALRQMHFYNKNGFADKCVRRINNRMFIKLSAFKEWIEETGKVA